MIRCAFIILTGLFLLTGCGSPPRDNPYDPVNQNYGYIDGYIAGKYRHYGMKDIGVIALPESIIVESDSTGYFVMDSVPPGNYTVHPYDTTYELCWDEDKEVEVSAGDTAYADTIYIDRLYRHWDFEDVSIGEIPTGWISFEGTWEVQFDTAAYEGNRTLQGMLGAGAADTLMRIVVGTDNIKNFYMSFHFKIGSPSGITPTRYSTFFIQFRNNLVSAYEVVVNSEFVRVNRLSLSAPAILYNDDSFRASLNEWHEMHLDVNGNTFNIIIDTTYLPDIQDDQLDNAGRIVIGGKYGDNLWLDDMFIYW